MMIIYFFFLFAFSPPWTTYVAFLRHDGVYEQSFFSWTVYASFMLAVSPCEALRNSLLASE